MTTTQLSWHINTAIDLFDSAAVIFNPGLHNLRAAWAAGVRSRLSAPSRETLQQVYAISWLPVSWFYQMDEPADAAQALEILSRTPSERRLRELIDLPSGPPELLSCLTTVIEEEKVTDHNYKEILRLGGKKEIKKDLKAWLTVLSLGRQLGGPLLPALREFYDIFYAEEEERVRPFLVQAAAEGEQLAQTMDLPSLMEHLSQGIAIEKTKQFKEILFAPSFWTTPLIAPGAVNDEILYFIYGARPSNVPLIPGDLVPTDLHQALKTLADPTRLKICRLLRQRPHNPGDLARELRLRPPTVTHHLHALRQARLVRITLTDDGRRTYELRRDGISTVIDGLTAFLDD